MELRFEAAELAFRDEVRQFLATRLPAEVKASVQAATGSFCDLSSRIRWHNILYEKGWAAPDWPAEYGGPGWTPTQRYIFAAECARAGAPTTHVFGLKMCGPVIMHYGTREQKQTYLPPILSGDHRWCQGYSEPGSGSDLASLKTSAVADGDDYVVNGTKIWTTLAHEATHIFCLVRTDPAVKPQHGISFLLIEMNSPGLSVRPIINISGEHEFNQLFFDNVRVPKSQRLGAEGEGWTVAKSLLEFERGAGYAAGLYAQIAGIKALAEAQGVLDSSFKARLAHLEIEVDAVDMLERRELSAAEIGNSFGVSSSVIKLQGSELIQRLDELAIEATGAAVCAEGSVAMGRYLYDRSVTIYGGTSEVQRNIIARAGLGL